VHVVSQRARVLRLRRIDQPLAINVIHRVAFLSLKKVGILENVFSKLNSRPTDTSVYASTDTSRCRLQDSRPGWIRYSFPVGLFHSLQHAGLSRRTQAGRRPLDVKKGILYLILIMCRACPTTATGSVWQFPMEDPGMFNFDNCRNWIRRVRLDYSFQLGSCCFTRSPIGSKLDGFLKDSSIAQTARDTLWT
jgi:hypothetical protein